MSDSCWLVLTRVRFVLIHVDLCWTRFDSCWLVSDLWWFVSHSCWLALIRVDSCWLVLMLVCVCVCVHPSTMKASSVWIRWDTREQINDVMFKMLNSSAGSRHHCFRMQNLTFQLVALSCFQTKSRQNHDLTSVRLVFKKWGLHSQFSRRCLRYALHREAICFCVNSHEMVRYLSRKG